MIRCSGVDGSEAVASPGGTAIEANCNIVNIIGVQNFQHQLSNPSCLARNEVIDEGIGGGQSVLIVGGKYPCLLPFFAISSHWWDAPCTDKDENCAIQLVLKLSAGACDCDNAIELALITVNFSSHV